MKTYFKGRTGLALLVFCVIVPLFSLVLLLPFVRTGMIALAEGLLHRELRDPSKWHRLIIRSSSIQLALSFAVAYLVIRGKELRGQARSFFKGLGIVHYFAFLLILSFIVQQLLYIKNPASTGWYMDFSNLWDHYVCVIGYQALRLGSYPPVAALFYRMFSAMVPEKLLSGDWRLLAYSDCGSYQALLYCLFSIVPFSLLCYCTTEGSRGKRLLVTASLCCSAPFLYSLMRGNIVSIAFCAAFYFCLSIDSRSPFVRATGMLALFAAIGIKLYPVAFAMLLVKEKRWKDLAFCMGIAFILFLFVLSFFGNGIAEILNLLKDISNFTSTFKVHHNLALKRQVWDILSFFCGETPQLVFSIVNALALVVYLALSAVLFFSTRKRWVELLLLVLACLLLPNIVRPYTEIFLVIPLVEMLNCRDKDLPLILSLVFMLPMLLFLYPLSLFITFHSALVTFPLLGLCAAEVIKESQ